MSLVLALFFGITLALLWLSTSLHRRWRVERRGRVDAEEALERARRVENLGRLSAGITHEFNNILSVLRSQIDGLEVLSSGGDIRHGLGSLRTLVTESAGLTSDILGLASQDPRSPGPMDPNQVIQGTASWLQRLVPKNIEVRTHLEPSSWPCLADSGRLRQAVINLALNARDALPEGGRVVFTTENLRGLARDNGQPPGDYIRISVSDNGEGIPPGLAHRIFDSFFTTKAAGQGTGLGLNLVREFIEDSDGHLEWKSEPGRGTRFSLLLPRVTSLDLIQEPAAAATLEECGQGERILLVEDNRELRSSLRDLLELRGYFVLEASDASAARRWLKSGSTVDLLFVDLGLPGNANGLELAREARAQRPRLAVIFTSGLFGANESADLASFSDGIELIHKPTPTATILRKVRETLDRRVLDHQALDQQVLDQQALDQQSGDHPRPPRLPRPSLASPSSASLS